MDRPTQSPGGSDSEDTVHYPKVVLVTGACRFLGGYLTARLVQNPLVNRVIAVDAIAPSKDMLRRMGRAEFVRADIRNPFIAKVIRNGGARGSRVVRPAIRWYGGVEGTQRDGRDATVRRLSEGAVGASSGAEV